MTKTYQVQANGLPLAPAAERTTIANVLARRGTSRPAPASKIGKLLESWVHRGA